MTLNIKFDKNHQATWLIPGYHRKWQKQLGKTIKTEAGQSALISSVDFQVKWSQMTTAEKKWVKQEYGINAKYKYHQFTRLCLDRVLPTQPLFPGLDWNAPNFEAQWVD